MERSSRVVRKIPTQKELDLFNIKVESVVFKIDELMSFTRSNQHIVEIDHIVNWLSDLITLHAAENTSYNKLTH